MYPLTFYANGGGFARQAFTLTVDRVPALRHVGTLHAPIGAAIDQSLKAAGYPVPALTETGTPGRADVHRQRERDRGHRRNPGRRKQWPLPVTVTAASSLGTTSESFVIVVP